MAASLGGIAGSIFSDRALKLPRHMSTARTIISRVELLRSHLPVARQVELGPEGHRSLSALDGISFFGSHNTHRLQPIIACDRCIRSKID